MLSQSLRTAIKPTSRQLLMIWAGEFFCFGLYYFVAYRAASQPKPPPESVDQMLPIILSVIGGASLLAGLAMKWFVFSQFRAQAFLARQMPSTGDTAQDETIEEKSLISLAKGSFQPYIMSLGMINSCILFGMVLSITQHDISTFKPFVIGTVIGGILCFPNLESFIEESMITWKHSFRRRT